MNRRTASSLRAAARGAVVESLELRRLLSYNPAVEITAPVREAGELFGSTIATNGDLALIGAPSQGGTPGRAFLLDASGASPQLVATFSNPNGQPGDGFGTAVAWVDGKIAVSEPTTSKVYLYDNAADTTPTEFNAPVFGPNSFGFGSSMTSIGTDLFVSVRDDGLGNGAVVRFDTTGVDTTPDIYTVGAEFFSSLYLTTKIIDANNKTILVTGSNNGIPSVIQLNPYTNALSYFDAPEFDFQYGQSVAVTANSILIGSPGANKVYEYFDQGGSREFTRPAGSQTTLGFGFGWSVAVSDGKVLISDNDADIPVDETTYITAAGEAYVFDLATGTHLDTLQSSTPAEFEEFGWVVAGLTGGKFLVADAFEDPNNVYGAVYLFTPTATAPTGPSITEENGVLFVIGSTGADNITIVKNDLGGFDVTMGALSANYTGGTIVVQSGDGNDVIGVSSAVTANVEIHGGAGDDSMSGGQGHDILVGDAGDDVLYGHTGRDLLIGGSGADALIGEVDDDILIAGSTIHDNNSIKLGEIMTIWTSSTMSVADRIAMLAEGGLLASGSLTVINDDQVDTLTGRNGDDWFFVSDGGVIDIITDQKDEDLAFIPAA